MRPNQSRRPTASHVYEVRPLRDKRDVDLIFDLMRFGWLCCGSRMLSATRFAELQRIVRLHLRESGNVRTTLAQTVYEAYPKMPQ